MKVEFVAFDSFGVKSSCTFVQTADIKICIDPGIAWETGSFPLPFAQKALLDAKYTKAIKSACKKSDAIIITHYHYDHHLPRLDFYKGKNLFIKDPKKNINKEQARRAQELLAITKNKATITIADGKTFKFKKTKIKFSKAVWHGVKGTKLGKVIMATIDDGKKKLLFSSDVDGPYTKENTNLIIKEKPDILILDGHPTYLLGYIASFAFLKQVIKNTIKILEKTRCELYILDHHLLRDYRYKELYYEVYKRAKELNKKVMTAAEFLHKKPKVIEGYERYGPTRWKSWQPLTFKRLDEIIAHAKAVAKKKK